MDSYDYPHERIVAERVMQRVAWATEHFRAHHLAPAPAPEDADRRPVPVPVTVAVYASQAILVAGIHGAFARDRFVGKELADQYRGGSSVVHQQVWDLVSTIKALEEQQPGLSSIDSPAWPESPEHIVDLLAMGGGSKTAYGHVWAVDAIAETGSYAAGYHYTGVAALLVDGLEELAVVVCPRLHPPYYVFNDLTRARNWDSDRFCLSERGCLLSAARGQGVRARALRSYPAYSSPPLCAFQGIPALRDGVRATFAPRAGPHRLTPASRRLAEPLPANSMQLRYVMCALGWCEFFSDALESSSDRFVWCHAGGMLLLSEIGGRTTDWSGRAIDWGVGRELGPTVEIFAATARFHTTVLGRGSIEVLSGFYFALDSPRE
ncbi:hypothetical protein B0T24DRAFT_662464 [Lasiosphaeria ovina]|uniref:Uncharacterized protein n=1 Tax=Lasiosphaeria ovina TaxID=92902 RepID=A0AAE0NMA5_9PEZI|nr:hypothetical protein B0T24DRAFT_662464 [Lasiosphaeria ovina]